MNLLVTLPDEPVRDRFFSSGCRERLNRAGSVEWNRHSRQFTALELREALRGVDVVLTGWHLPALDQTVLDRADKLKLVAHLGGTVAPVATEELYRRGVRVCSGNRVMARVVAEAILGSTLAGLRDLSALDRDMHAGVPWPRDLSRCRSLLGARVGFVGLGAVGRAFLDLLAPFGVTVSVFDPYVGSATLAPWPFASKVERLEESLAGRSVVSLHASRTEETRHLLGRNELAHLDDRTLLVNAARGALIDENALRLELESGRIRAALDVYAEEPLPVEHAFRSRPNVILIPHMAGAPSHRLIGEAMVDEVERFAAGEPLRHEIPLDQFRRMTR